MSVFDVAENNRSLCVSLAAEGGGGVGWRVGLAGQEPMGGERGGTRKGRQGRGEGIGEEKEGRGKICGGLVGDLVLSL